MSSPSRPLRYEFENDDTVPSTPTATRSDGASAIAPASLAVLDEAADVVEVDPGAFGEHVGDLGVAAFDVEEGEVGGVIGHEPHAGFGAVSDPGDRVGRRDPSRCPVLGGAASRIVRTSSANSAPFVGKYQ